MLIIRAAFVFDGVADAFLVDQAIIIDGDKIIEIKPWDQLDQPSGVEIIEHSGYVLPGLIDCHVHVDSPGAADPRLHMNDPEGLLALRASKHMRETLDAGFTTVRNLGSKFDVDLSVAKSVESDIIAGPRMICSGRCVTMTGGHGHFMGYEADGVDEVRKAVRTLLKQGVQVIKLMATGGVLTEGVEPGAPQLTIEEMRAGVEEAHKAGRLTATHAQGTIGIKNAVLAGIDSVEHGIFLDEEVVELMVKNDTALVPTLAAPHNIIVNGIEAGIPEYAVRKTEGIVESHIRSFQMAYKAGIRIGLGTDAGTPFNYHGMNAMELELMVKAGMSTVDALKSATSSAAEICGIGDQIGRIGSGYQADLLLVKANPLDGIASLRQAGNIVKVIARGKIIG